MPVRSFLLYLVLLLGLLLVCYLASEQNAPVTEECVSNKTAQPEQPRPETVQGTIVTDPDPSREQVTEPPLEIPPVNTSAKKNTGYYSSVLSLSDADLKEGLHELIRKHRALTYGQLWDALTILDAADDGAVMLIYARKPRAADQHGGDHGEWNREHLWPRAYGISRSSPANTDLHHIRASDVKTNADRGHLYFDETEGDTTPGTIFSSDHDSWEPPLAVKGDVARALFYMAVRYEGGEPNESDLELADTPDISKRTHGKLSTLIEWHRLDPVSEEEKVRNDRIFRNYQGNRNPFIDHPEFVQRVFVR